jgi:hypothetical protein
VAVHIGTDKHESRHAIAWASYTGKPLSLAYLQSYLGNLDLNHSNCTVIGTQLAGTTMAVMKTVQTTNKLCRCTCLHYQKETAYLFYALQSSVPAAKQHRNTLRNTTRCNKTRRKRCMMQQRTGFTAPPGRCAKNWCSICGSGDRGDEAAAVAAAGAPGDLCTGEDAPAEDDRLKSPSTARAPTYTASCSRPRNSPTGRARIPKWLLWRYLHAWR